MSDRFHDRLFAIVMAATVMLVPVRSLRAQEAEIVSEIAGQIVKGLGADAAEFGGKEIAEQTAQRLVSAATESAGSAGGQIAKTQVARIVAGGESMIFDLKSISGESLPLLEDLSDEELPAAVSTLARPGIGDGIQSLDPMALKKAALIGEMRLPGAGLKLVSHYGAEGARLVPALNEDQANSLVAALRPKAVNALPSAERSKLLDALTSRSDARIFNLERLTGPLVVVASGIVIWHGIDVGLSSDERVTERPDGTVVREKTSVGSRLINTVPDSVRELSTPVKWTGVTFAVGATFIALVALWRREKRARVR